MLFIDVSIRLISIHIDSIHFFHSNSNEIDNLSNSNNNNNSNSLNNNGNATNADNGSSVTDIQDVDNRLHCREKQLQQGMG